MKLILIGNLIFVVACAVVGVRLLLLWLRTREVPELLMGTGFVGGAVIGQSLGVYLDLGQPPEPLYTVVYSISRCVVAISSAAALTSVWWIFRPTQRWAAVLVGICLVLHLPTIFPRALTGTRIEAELIHHPEYWAWICARIFGYWWMALECATFFLRLRRRHRIGIKVDLTLASRVLLWGLAHALVAVMFSVLGVNKVLTVQGNGIPDILIISILGTITAGLMWSSFSPPRWLFRSRRRARPAA